MGEAYESTLGSLIDAQEATVPFYSTLTGDLHMGKGALGAAYWRKNLESPVLFNSAVQSYIRDNSADTLFVEVGPQ